MDTDGRMVGRAGLIAAALEMQSFLAPPHIPRTAPSYLMLALVNWVACGLSYEI